MFKAGLDMNYCVTCGVYVDTPVKELIVQTAHDKKPKRITYCLDCEDSIERLKARGILVPATPEQEAIAEAEQRIEQIKDKIRKKYD
jgi:hypothetical protein